MRLHSRLNVVDGKVVCPHTCKWKAIEGCGACTELQQIGAGQHGQVVVCEPDVARPFSDVLADMVRG